MCMKSAAAAAAALNYFLSFSPREMVVLNGDVVRFAIDVDSFTSIVWEKKNIWLNEKKSNKKRLVTSFVSMTDC